MKTTKRKNKKMTTERKILMVYVAIVEEKGTEVEISKIKRIALKKKTRKQIKPLMEMMMN